MDHCAELMKPGMTGTKLQTFFAKVIGPKAFPAPSKGAFDEISASSVAEIKQRYETAKQMAAGRQSNSSGKGMMSEKQLQVEVKKIDDKVKETKMKELRTKVMASLAKNGNKKTVGLKVKKEEDKKEGE